MEFIQDVFINREIAIAEYTEKYRIYFDVAEFAIYHAERETENYKAFKERFEE